MEDHNPIGLIYLNEEPEELIIKKWIAWIIVMALFIIIVLVTIGYFDTTVCPIDSKYLHNTTLTSTGIYVTD
jgi:hypothetical protein